MSAIVLLTLPLSLLAILTVLGLAFEDAAFRPLWAGVKGGGQQNLPAYRPLPSVELASTAERMSEVEVADLSQLVCPETPFLPQVTLPEAQAIATEVRRYGPLEVRRVVDRSRTAHGMCPLRLKNGLCACAAARPLACIGRCVAGGDSPDWAEGLGQSMSEAFRRHLETRHADASTQSLDEALLPLLQPECDLAVSRQG